MAFPFDNDAADNQHSDDCERATKRSTTDAHLGLFNSDDYISVYDPGGDDCGNSINIVDDLMRDADDNDCGNSNGNDSSLCLFDNSLGSDRENATISDHGPSNNSNGDIAHDPGDFSNSDNCKSMHDPGGDEFRNSTKVDSMCDDNGSTGSSNNRLQVLSSCTPQFLVSTANRTSNGPTNCKDDDCQFVYDPGGDPLIKGNTNAARRSSQHTASTQFFPLSLHRPCLIFNTVPPPSADSRHADAMLPQSGEKATATTANTLEQIEFGLTKDGQIFNPLGDIR